MTSLARLRLKRPIFQAPMAGAQDETLAIAVTAAGGLGGLPAGMLSPEALEHALAAIEGHGPVNVNFFCHTTPEAQPERLERWRERLEPYHQELGIAPPPPSDSPTRRPFDEASCAIVEKHKPAVVSFHFGLPSAELVERVKRCGALVMSSATTLDEARWLEANGADVIIAQGTEAGGHRGHFLSDDLSLQQPLAKLLPSIVEAVAVPVVAAGGIADPQGVRWALDQGAAAVQIAQRYCAVRRPLCVPFIARRCWILLQRPRSPTSFLADRPGESSTGPCESWAPFPERYRTSPWRPAHSANCARPTNLAAAVISHRSGQVKIASTAVRFPSRNS